jgi:hypothetical protein
MYMGEITDAPPMPRPPINLKTKKRYQLLVKAHPRADIKKKAPSRDMIGLRPNFSVGLPELIDPIIVPIRATATVKPNRKSPRLNTCSNDEIVPEMTAVSKPNKKPPSAATIVLQSTYHIEFVSADANTLFIGVSYSPKCFRII